ncbi:MAG: hypothetical protein ABSB19_02250 [Methylomonas sp.]|jgi:hypothetical protein
MSNITDSKPEPIAAKPNWHYDSYFLAQLKRLNLHAPDSPLPTQTKLSIKNGNRNEEIETGPETEEGQ